MTFSERKAIRIVAQRISACTGISRREVESRLHCHDTEQEILDDHAMCLLLGLPTEPVPFWRIIFRSERYGCLREEDIEGLVRLVRMLDMIDAADEAMTIECEYEKESDRWIASVVHLPGVMGYHRNRGDAIDKAISLAREVMHDRIQHGEWQGSVDDLRFVVTDTEGKET